MLTREHFVIRRNEDGEANAGKFLDTIGEWFIHFDENLFLAMIFEDIETAERVVRKYMLSDCKIRKVQMTMELK